MIRLNNDYCHGAIPEILEALQTTNSEAYAGYELDEWCERAGALIKEAAACPDAAVHYIVGGTQANVAFIAHALRPWESVVCADCGHINVHETGATEHIGHKCETVPARDGKLAASDLRAVARGYAESPVSEHVTVPRMAYISFPSESGTVYSLAELEALRAVCDEFGMYLFVDGARLAYGLAASGNDVTLPDIARLSDAFYIGGLYWRHEMRCAVWRGHGCGEPGAPAVFPQFHEAGGHDARQGLAFGSAIHEAFRGRPLFRNRQSRSDPSYAH